MLDHLLGIEGRGSWSHQQEGRRGRSLAAAGQEGASPGKSMVAAVCILLLVAVVE